MSYSYRRKFPQLEQELITSYELYLRSFIVDYMLLEPTQRRLLNIHPLPELAWPTFVIRAPVPWHQSKVTASHLIEHNLFVTNEIVRRIHDIWSTKYRHIRILRIEDLGEFPVLASEIYNNVEKICKASREKLIKEWLAEVAELFLEFKDSWSGLFDKCAGASTALVQKYFRHVDGILSQQLRIIVVETMTSLRDFFVSYGEGNAFEGDYQDLMFTRYVYIYFFFSKNSLRQTFYLFFNK